MDDFSRIKLNEDTFRNEVKYKFYTKSLSSWMIKIKNSDINFKTHHEERWVNNIYFDSLSLDLFKQSHEGSSPRTKIRLRWYGDFFQSDNKCNLELKIKFANKNNKIIFPILNISILKNTFINSINSKLLQCGVLPNEILNLFYSIKPTLINRYKRNYFVQKNSDTRLTLDSCLGFKSLLNRSKLSLPFCENKNLTIIELKFNKKNNLNKEIMNKINSHLTVSQFSKYTYGIQTS